MHPLTLGWTLGAGTTHSGCQSHKIGNICLISAALPQVPTPLRRLEVMTELFNAGVDVLPLAPKAHLSLSDGLRWTQENCDTLQRALMRLRGLAQLSLQVETTAPKPVAPHAGQSWLRHRQNVQARKQALLAAQSQAMKRLFLVVSQYPLCTQQDMQNPALGHILLRRSMVQEIAARLRTTADKDGDQIAKIRLTGPWPPYAFSQLSPPPLVGLAA